MAFRPLVHNSRLLFGRSSRASSKLSVIFVVSVVLLLHLGYLLQLGLLSWIVEPILAKGHLVGVVLYSLRPLREEQGAALGVPQ